MRIFHNFQILKWSFWKCSNFIHSFSKFAWSTFEFKSIYSNFISELKIFRQILLIFRPFSLAPLNKFYQKKIRKIFLLSRNCAASIEITEKKKNLYFKSICLIEKAPEIVRCQWKIISKIKKNNFIFNWIIL